MIQNEEYPQRHTVERLRAFGFERFEKAVKELVQETETAASSNYSPDFDMLALPDGSAKIAPVVNINNIAQLMYHEFMNMIMRGAQPPSVQELRQILCSVWRSHRGVL